MEKQDNQIIFFLNKIGVKCETVTELNDRTIYRETLLNKETYQNIKEDIPKLKQQFSSSYMTSLQSSASDNQKWPLLNLVRQILKARGYHLVPKRLCDGYTKEGKKKYKRIFIIRNSNADTNKQDIIGQCDDQME